MYMGKARLFLLILKKSPAHPEPRAEGGRGRRKLAAAQGVTEEMRQHFFPPLELTTTLFPTLLAF